MHLSNIQSFEEYQKAYSESIQNPEDFWAEIANELTWKTPFNKVLEWNFNEPNVKWFIGGKLNFTENCLDRHLETRGNHTAILWEPNNPNEQFIKLSYLELYFQVC